MARHKKRHQEGFDDHMGLSTEEVSGVLKFFCIPERDFNEWITGQTCLILPNGKIGFYWYDVKRFVKWKTKGIIPIWD